MYFLRRLRAFGVDEKILVLFYRSIIESILRYGITAWFGNLYVQLKSQLSRLMRTGSTSPMIRRFLNTHYGDSQSRLFMIPNMFYIINFSSCHLADAIELLHAGLIDTNIHMCHCLLQTVHHYHYLNSYTGFLLFIELILSCPPLHIMLYLHNNNPTWLVPCIFQISLGSSDHQFHNLSCLRQNLTWANVLSCYFPKKTQDIFIPNCISTINLRLFLFRFNFVLSK